MYSSLNFSSVGNKSSIWRVFFQEPKRRIQFWTKFLLSYLVGIRFLFLLSLRTLFKRNWFVYFILKTYHKKEESQLIFLNWLKVRDNKRRKLCPQIFQGHWTVTAH